MAPVFHVLRLALDHDQSSHALVAVSSSSSSSSSSSKDASSDSEPLDLELLATDDQKAYVMTLSHARISRYKHSNTPCTDSEWEDALKALLLPEQPIGKVEATAHIGDDEDKPTGDETSYMFINVKRRGVSKQTEPLGVLKLRKSHKAEASVELFDWCVESISARDKLEQDIIELRREHESLQSLVAEETAKVQELARSKQEFEALHDSWLKDLLNEKKVKIRMQEQILATAHVDPDKLACATAAATASKPHHSRAGMSRKGKRKAQGLDHSDKSTSSNGEADEMDLDVDESHEGDEIEDVDMATTDSETASETGSNPKAKGTARKKTESSGNTGKAGHNLRDKNIVVPDESDDEASTHQGPPREKQPAPADDPDDVSTASE